MLFTDVITYSDVREVSPLEAKTGRTSYPEKKKPYTCRYGLAPLGTLDIILYCTVRALCKVGILQYSSLYPSSLMRHAPLRPSAS